MISASLQVICRGVSSLNLWALVCSLLLKCVYWSVYHHGDIQRAVFRTNCYKILKSQDLPQLMSKCIYHQKVSDFHGRCARRKPLVTQKLKARLKVPFLQIGGASSTRGFHTEIWRTLKSREVCTNSRMYEPVRTKMNPSTFPLCISSNMKLMTHVGVPFTPQFTYANACSQTLHVEFLSLHDHIWWI